MYPDQPNDQDTSVAPRSDVYVSRQLLPLVLIIVGATLMHLYLFSVRVDEPYHINLLVVGVLAQSIGIMILVYPILLHRESHINTSIFMICVLSLSFSINFMAVTRYSIPFNTDAPKEYQAAYVTRDSWSPSLATREVLPGEIGFLGRGFLFLYDYIGTLSVTVLPSVVCRIAGITTFDMFSYVFPTIVSLMPLTFFLVMRRFFGKNPLVYLSVALMPMYLVFNGGFMAFYRSAVAIVLLYMLLLYSSLKDQRTHLIVILLGFGIVTAHYTVAYISIMLLAFFLLAWVTQRFEKRSRLDWSAEKIVSPIFFVIFFAMTMTWAIYVNWGLFVDHAYRLGYYLTTGREAITLSPEMGYLAGNRRGIGVTAWFILEYSLVAIGGIFGLRQLVKGSLNGLQSAWVICGCGTIIYIAASALIPSILFYNIFLEPPRAIVYFIPFIMLFLAWALLKIAGRISWIFVAPFIIAMLPMNMLLPAHSDDLNYHPISEISPDMVATMGTGYSLGPSYMKGASWIREHVDEDEYLQVDSVSYMQMAFGIFPMNMMERFWPPKLTPTKKAIEQAIRPIRYLVVHDLYMQYGIWHQIYNNRTTIVQRISPDSLLSDPVSNMAYDNGALMLFTTD